MSQMSPQNQTASREKSLSLAHGNSIEASDKFTVLGDFLRHAAAQPAPKAVLEMRADGPARRLAYPEVLSRAESILGALRQRGMRPGDKILLQLDAAFDYFSVFWAAQLGGFIAVPTSLPPDYQRPHAATNKLQNAWELLEHPLIVSTAARLLPLRELGQRLQLPDWSIESVDQLATAPRDTRHHAASADDVAVLLLTSGSTGLPKAVALSHHNLIAQVRGNIHFHSYSSADVSINWMPLDHVGALVMFHLRDVCLGCDQLHVLPEIILQNVKLWLQWIHDYRVTNTWAPNFAYALINDSFDQLENESWDLSCLRYAINGGEAVVSRTARRFVSLLSRYKLPSTAMWPAWGMSETCSGTTYFERFRLDTISDQDTFVSVGRPIPGISLRIVDSTGSLVEEGVTGSLQVAGPVVTRGYYRNEKATKDAFTPDGWFKTGDLAFLCGEELTIAGREKDVIIINGANFYGHEIEAVVEDVNGVEVSFTAATAVRSKNSDTDELAVFFSPVSRNDEASLKKQIRAAILREQGVSVDHLIALPKERIPKTAIGKIQRAELRRQFEADAFVQPNPLPNWFFHRKWTEQASSAGATNQKFNWLIFKDTFGLGDAIAQKLQQAGEFVRSVNSGASFEIIDPHAVVINPTRAEDYSRAFELLNGSPNSGCAVLHLWTYSPHFVQAKGSEFETLFQRGADSFLHLTSAFARWSQTEVGSRFVTVSSRAQSVVVDDVIEPAHGALLGLIKTIRQEVANLDCTHVDTEDPVSDELAEAILSEVLLPSPPLEVAVRAKKRWISGLATLPPSVDSSSVTEIKKGGFYVVTGGLGGVGQTICAHLLKEYQATLAITGREDLSAFGSEKQSALERLKQDGDVVYEKVDTSNLVEMRAWWQRVAETRQRVPDGFFHLAGHYHERILAEESVVDFHAALQAKAKGAWVIAELTKEHPETQLIFFSSLLGYFGGFMTGAYSAANHFLETLTDALRHEGRKHVHCLLWSSWAKLGMSKDVGDNAGLRGKGFLPISAEQGFQSLVFSLRTDKTAVLIGLDGSNRQVAAQLLDPQQAELKSSNTLVLPRDETERKLAEIWKTLLKLSEVGVKDSFFDLGGRSLLAARLFSQINQQFGKSLPLATLFTFSTIEQLANIIRGKGTPAHLAKPPASRVITLQAGNNRPAFFCIPGRETNNLMYRDLVRPLGKQLPIFSLKAEPLEPCPQPLPIEKIAEELLYQIRLLQPKGPYMISGHRFGTLIAWAIGTKLGDELGQLILLDPPANEFYSKDRESFRFITPAKRPNFLARLFGSPPGPTTAERFARARYEDFVLNPIAKPVIVFSSSNENSPWQALSKNGFTYYSTTALSKELPLLLKP